MTEARSRKPEAGRQKIRPLASVLRPLFPSEARALRRARRRWWLAMLGCAAATALMLWLRVR